MNRRSSQRGGEKGIINAVERCLNLRKEWEVDRKLPSRLKFELSVRMLVEKIPEDWQDSQYVDDLYNVCLDLLMRKGYMFVKG